MATRRHHAGPRKIFLSHYGHLLLSLFSKTLFWIFINNHQSTWVVCKTLWINPFQQIDGRINWMRQEYVQNMFRFCSTLFTFWTSFQSVLKKIFLVQMPDLFDVVDVLTFLFIRVRIPQTRFSPLSLLSGSFFFPLLTYQRVLHLWVRDTLSLTFCVRDAAVVLSTLKRKPVLLVATQLPRWDLTTGLWRLREEELPVPVEWLTWSTCPEDSTTVSKPPSRLNPLKCVTNCLVIFVTNTTTFAIAVGRRSQMAEAVPSSKADSYRFFLRRSELRSDTKSWMTVVKSAISILYLNTREFFVLVYLMSPLDVHSKERPCPALTILNPFHFPRILCLHSF